MNRPYPGNGWLTAGLILSIARPFFLPFICGDSSVKALPVSIFTVFCAWYPRVDYKQDSWNAQMAAALVRVVATLLFAMNLAEVLWLGYDAVFG